MHVCCLSIGHQTLHHSKKGVSVNFSHWEAAEGQKCGFKQVIEREIEGRS
jgi:hypothetical protein